MNDHADFEARLGAAFAAYADRAPVEVDPISLTAAVARGRSRRAWSFAGPRAPLVFIGAAVGLLALAAALAVGAYLLRSKATFGGGGLMIVSQADVVAGRPATRPVSIHVFGLDAATGDRVAIADWPVPGQSVGDMSATWSPDRSHALLFDVFGQILGIVDVSSHQVAKVQLRATDASLSFAERFAWSSSGDRIASIVSDDTSPAGSVLISGLDGHEIDRLSLPPDWSAGRPTWSPDGSSLALTGCLGCSDLKATSHLLLLPLDGSPVRVLLEPAFSYGTPVWSPDGSTIAIDSGDGIVAVDVSTGRQRTLPGGRGSQQAWSPDGRRIAFTRIDGLGNNAGIFVVDLDSDQVAQLTSGPDGSPDWSPDGTSLVFGRGHGVYSDVWIIGADGGEPQFLVEYAAADW